MDKLKLNKIDKPAFTIIEVVLVLAIAGLIFLMVFIALPALQRNQRDTQRKNDMSRVVSALTSYRANNRGKLPTNGYIGTGGTSASQLLTKYLRLDGDQFNDPSGDPYLMRASARNVGQDYASYIISEEYKNQVWVSLGNHCDGSVIIAAGPAQFAVQYLLESGLLVILFNILCLCLFMGIVYHTPPMSQAQRPT